MSRLDYIRQIVSENKKNQENRGSFTDNTFQFKDLKFGDKVAIRFIDDKGDNLSFTKPKCFRTLPFDGIRTVDGAVYSNKVFVNVPAFNVKRGEDQLLNLPPEYIFKSDDDVIQGKIGPLYDGTPEGKELYNRYKRKTVWVYQGFIHSENYEANKVYRFTISKGLHDTIESYVDNDEMTEVPSDIDHGRDFTLKVTKKVANINNKSVELKDYSTSMYGYSECPLTPSEREVIANGNHFDLKTFIYKKPTEEELAVMLEMYEASVNEEPYDIAKWSKYFKPMNIRLDANGNIIDKDNKLQASTELPSQPTVVQPVMEVNQQPTQVVYATIPPQVATISPVQAGEQVAMAQMQQAYAQPMMQQPVQQAQPNWGGWNQPQNRQMLVDSPVAKPVEAGGEGDYIPNFGTPTQQQSVRETIKNNTETVDGKNPADVVANIMSQLTGA